MYCVNCGSLITSGSQFCGQCGARVADHSRATGSSQPRQNARTFEVPRGPSGEYLSGTIQTTRPVAFPEVPHQMFLIIGVAQVIGVAIFLIKYWSEISSFGGSFDGFVEYAIPFALGDLILVAPIVLAGISVHNADNPTLLSAALVSGLIQFTRAVPSVLERGVNFDFYNIGPTSSATTFLPTSLIAVAAVFVIPLAILRLKPGPSMMGPQSDWWRGTLGFFAVVFLMFEHPGRVLSDRWPVLGLVVLITMTASGLMESRTALGAALGLSAAVAGSIIAFGGHWVLLGGDRYGFSIVSMPSLLALVLSAIVVATTWKHAPLQLNQQSTRR